MNPGVSSRGSPTPRSISSRPSAAACAARRSSSSKGYGATPRLVGSDRDRAGPGPARERLADTAFPHANADVAVRDPDELDVRPLREQLVMLERRSDVLQVVTIRILVHEHDKVRVAHAQRRG